MPKILLFCLTTFGFAQLHAQLLTDDNETLFLNWQADACGLDVGFQNPFMNGGNPSQGVLRYHDTGGQYANIRFDAPENLKLYQSANFSFKIYIPSAGLTGNQVNQVSLKLQNNLLNEPWTTQCEVIKPVVLDQWQTVTFDFLNDNFLNFEPNSPDPIYRNDLNRILIQVNGENNNDQVLAYIDDFQYNGGVSGHPIYNYLAWSDEFNIPGAVQASHWFHQTILPAGGSWYNNEIQHYTDRTDNAIVNNGILSIIAKKEVYTNQNVTKQYTSARLNSKFAFTYGRVEVRAKLPTGIGTWPAIWMLGQNINENGAYWQTQGYGTTSWPACGEIDIMEHWGNEQNYIQSAMHTPSSFGNTINHGGRTIPNVSNAFHTYTLDWFPDRMVFSVDGIVHYVYMPNVQNAATWPFDAPQYLLLNIAIEASILPNFTQSSMDIEYVRVYQQAHLSTPDFDLSTSVLIYPNPAQDELLIQTGNSQSYLVEIYDVLGNLVIQTNRENDAQEPINIAQLISGVYVVRITQNGRSETLKLVKS